MIRIISILLLVVTILNVNAQTRKKTTTKKVTKTVTQQPAKNNYVAPQPSKTTPATTPALQSNNTRVANNNKQSRTPFSNTGLGLGKHISKGSKVFNAGIGFSNYGLPVHLSFEKFVANDFTAGIFLNGQSFSNSGFGFGLGDNYILAHGGLKGNYYFNYLLGVDDDIWHFGAGLSLGYWRYFDTGSSVGSLSSTGNFFLSSQIDMRYFFKKHWGIMLEGQFGGMNAGIIGICYR